MANILEKAVFDLMTGLIAKHLRIKMAKNEIKFTVPDFVTSTRVKYCGALNCVHMVNNENGKVTCELKQVEINDNGCCKQFEDKNEN
jgi:hypothetical protein